MGYLHYKRSDKDRRSVRVSLTPKGMEARDVDPEALSAPARLGGSRRPDLARRLQGPEQGAGAPGALLDRPDPLPPVGPAASRLGCGRRRGALRCQRLARRGALVLAATETDMARVARSARTEILGLASWADPRASGVRALEWRCGGRPELSGPGGPGGGVQEWRLSLMKARRLGLYVAGAAVGVGVAYLSGRSCLSIGPASPDNRQAPSPRRATARAARRPLRSRRRP